MEKTAKVAKVDTTSKIEDLVFRKVEKELRAIKVLKNKIRKMIVELLRPKAMNVTDIYTELRLEQSIASQHLAQLRRIGVLITDRQGKYIYYSVDKNRLEELQRIEAAIVG